MTQHAASCNTTKNVYRPDIDGLRAIAVLLVVGYHAFPKLVRGGFIGVDVFFVISGFLITSIIVRDLDRGTFSFWEFYQRRIRRIFPALLLVLSAVLLFGWFALMPDEYEALGKHVFGGAAFISNFLFWQEAGYWDVSGKLKPLLHLWSLGIEEQFYIVFPLVALLTYKAKLRFLFVFSVILLVSFYCNMRYVIKNPVLDFYAPYTRFWELLIGSMLAVVLHKCVYCTMNIKDKVNRFFIFLFFNEGSTSSKYVINNLSSFFGVLLIFLAVKYSKVHVNFPGYQALLPTIGTLLIIAAGRHAWINKIFLSNKVIVAIGLISYPLYLWHWPIISYLHIIFGKISGTNLWIWLQICGIFFSVLLSYCTYEIVEKPFRFREKHKNAKSFALLLMMLAVGSCGGYLYFNNGVPGRKSITLYEKYFDELKPLVTQDASAYIYAPTAPRDNATQCRYTNVGSESTVALFGDSHALSAYYGIAAYNASMNVNTFLLSRNSSSIPILSLLLDEQSASKNISLQIFNTINTHKDIKSVFIFSRGPWAYGNYDKKTFQGIMDTKTPVQAFEESLQIAVNIFKEHGKKVFIVVDNPLLPQDIRHYLSRPFSNAKNCDTTKKDVLQMQDAYRKAINRIDGAVVIETIDFFCQNENIRLFDEMGLPIYMDNDHLSRAGSLFQAKHALAPYLELIHK